MKFEDIPSYYLKEGLPMYLMLYNTDFKSISTEEFMEKYATSIRNDDPIIDDLTFALFCLSEWMIDELPKNVLDYIDNHLDEDYSQYEEDLPIYYNLIVERIKFMKGFKQIDCGKSHSVGLRNDGTVVTWGGNNDNERNDTPAGKFIKIACGGYHSVGIREDGTVVTWGDNNFKQREDNPSGKFIDIACGVFHSVGIREDRTVVTWGNIRSEQRKDSPTGKFISISCGDYHSVGLRIDGSVITWGVDNYGQRDNIP